MEDVTPNPINNILNVSENFIDDRKQSLFKGLKDYKELLHCLEVLKLFIINDSINILLQTCVKEALYCRGNNPFSEVLYLRLPCAHRCLNNCKDVSLLVAFVDESHEL